MPSARPPEGHEAAHVGYGTVAGRWVMLATVLGSGMAFLDSTVVNVALPAIGADLGADVAGLQWVVNGYLVSLSALILLGGSLGDRHGRRRVFALGVIWFAVASALCAAAVTPAMLIAARLLQGVGGALLTPGSLAIIEAVFAPEDRGRAIGAWSGLSGVAAALGPFVGGWLVDVVSWRLVFVINLPLAALVVLAARHVPESSDPEAAPRPDTAGALLASAGLGAATYALIAAGDPGPAAAPVVVTGLAGGVALVAFVLVERRSRQPMVPPDLFASRQFTGANLTTVGVYAALGAAFFLLVVYLQQVLGYSALGAGAAVLPATGLLLVLSSRSGALAQRIGPRLQMTTGPLVIAASTLLLATLRQGDRYFTDVFPGVALLGFGLAVTVAPLTATVLGAVPDRRAGIASGVNNAVARAAQLAAVAVVPVAAGITGEAFDRPDVFTAGFRSAMFITAALAASGGVVAAVTIRNPTAGDVREPSCGMDAPPLRQRR